MTHDDLPIGVIHIPVQSRPASAGDYGKVVKEAVYIGRKFDRNRESKEIMRMVPRQPRRPGQPTTRLHLEEPLRPDGLGENVFVRDTGS